MLDSSIWTLEVDLGGSRSSTFHKSVSKMLWGNIACSCMNGPTFPAMFPSLLGSPNWLKFNYANHHRGDMHHLASDKVSEVFHSSAGLWTCIVAILTSDGTMHTCNSSQIFGVPSKKCCKLKLSLTPNWRWWRFLGQVDASCLDDNCYVMCFVEQPVEKMIRWPVEKTVGGKKNGKEAPASKKKEYDKERVWLKAKRQKVFKRNNMTKQTSRIHHFR